MKKSTFHIILIVLSCLMFCFAGCSSGRSGDFAKGYVRARVYPAHRSSISGDLYRMEKQAVEFKYVDTLAKPGDFIEIGQHNGNPAYYQIDDILGRTPLDKTEYAIYIEDKTLIVRDQFDEIGRVPLDSTGFLKYVIEEDNEPN